MADKYDALVSGVPGMQKVVYASDYEALVERFTKACGELTARDTRIAELEKTVTEHWARVCELHELLDAAGKEKVALLGRCSARDAATEHE